MNKELEALNILRDNHIQFSRERYGKLDKETLQNIINRKLVRWGILEEALKRNEPLKEEGEENYQYDEWCMPVGKCPICNEYNPCSAKYCRECGQALEKIEKGE